MDSPSTETDSCGARADHQRGAGLVEYALLLSLIALVCVAAVALLGGATGGQLSSAAELFPD